MAEQHYKEVDYIIVGQGVAGSVMALKLLKEGHSFYVIDANTHKASAIAAGIFNPIVLTWFAMVWDARKQITRLREVFHDFEQLLGKKYIYDLPVFRIIRDENEKKTWTKKANRIEFDDYLSVDFNQLNPYPAILQPLGAGEVLETGRIDLPHLLSDFNRYLQEQHLLRVESFDFSALQQQEDAVLYKHIKAKKIIFAEGYQVLQNPFFKNLPIIGNKGEVLTITLDVPLPQAVIKAKEFLMPIGEKQYFLGSTYEKEQIDYKNTSKGYDYLINGFKAFIEADFRVLDHRASIRPTVSDRRPIVGPHPHYPNLICLNGMGTRGTMLAPTMVDELYAFLTSGRPIHPEASIARFAV